jgi:hypothetical protein
VYNRSGSTQPVSEIVSIQYNSSGIETYHISETIPRNSLGRITAVPRARV